MQLIAVEHLHKVNIEHTDIKRENIAFGSETLPAGVPPMKGITYDTDVYLYRKNQTDYKNFIFLCIQKSTCNTSNII